jgi:hypothetical protein
MPVHDWTRIEAGIFHSFHLSWIGELSKALNDGLLPDGYYALAEQHAGRTIPDVLPLHGGPSVSEATTSRPDSGGTAVAVAPPQTRRHQLIDPRGRRRTLAIRHVSGHRLIAMIEIISLANKDREKSVERFVSKAVAALQANVHLLLVDLFPPAAFDPMACTGRSSKRSMMLTSRTIFPAKSH